MSNSLPSGSLSRHGVEVQALLGHRVQPRRTQRHQPRSLGLDALALGCRANRATALAFTSIVDPVLRRLPVRDDLEPDGRPLTQGSAIRSATVAQLRLGYADRAQVGVPGVETRPWRRRDVVATPSAQNTANARVRRSRSPAGRSRPSATVRERRFPTPWSRPTDTHARPRDPESDPNPPRRGACRPECRPCASRPGRQSRGWPPSRRCVAVPSAVPASPPRPAERSPTRIWGVTLDDVTHSRALASSLRRLPERTVARVVFDPGMPPASYAGALRRLHPVADVMGQPVDSSETSSYSVARTGPASRPTSRRSRTPSTCGRSATRSTASGPAGPPTSSRRPSPASGWRPPPASRPR